jgi:hypothetical protein
MVESIACEGMDMKPIRFTEGQIIGMLREHGAKTSDVCRQVRDQYCDAAYFFEARSRRAQTGLSKEEPCLAGLSPNLSAARLHARIMFLLGEACLLQ